MYTKRINILEFLHDKNVQEYLIEHVSHIYLALEDLNRLTGTVLTISNFIDNIPNNKLFVIIGYAVNDDVIREKFLSRINELRELRNRKDEVIL